MRPASRVLLAAGLCAGFLALSEPAIAADTVGYAGLSIGAAKSTIDKESVEFDTRDFSPTATAWRAFGGYQVSDYLGIEAGYVSLGKGEVTDLGGDYFEAEVTGVEFTPVGSLPVARGLSLFARGGAIFWRSDIGYRFTASGSGTEKESGTNLALSLGARYALSRRWGVRAEYSLYAIDKAKAGAGGFGVASISGSLVF
jgi:opacity protein-like surface antigen